MALTPSMYGKVKRGDKAPDFRLPGVDGKEYSPKGFKGNVLLVVFMANHCPYVKHRIGTIVALHNKFGKQGLDVVGISSNDVTEYPDDSFDKMKDFAKERDMRFPYLYDETQEVAKAYGASCTPDPFLFDASHRLAYHGRIDDAMEPGTKPSTHEMQDAIEQLLAGKAVTVKELPSIGCSIKWKK